MVGNTHLPREEAVAAHLRGACDAGLCRRDGVLADLHVVADLDQVVQFHAPPDDRRIGFGAVDAGIGADLHVVFYHDVAQLGDLVEPACGIGHESESVGADHGARVQDAVAADKAAFVDLDPRIEDGAFSHTYARSEVYLRIDLASVADLYVGLDYREVAYVAPFAHLGFGADRGQRAYAAAAGFCGIVHFEEFQDAGACVVDLDERRRKRLRGFERAVDQHDRRSGSVNIGFVFGIGKIAERAGLAFLDRRYGVYFRLFVADDFTAQESGDHFGCEFHHKIIIGIC